ncbi:carboxypeptidase B-like protein [Leptotrombidium deliense]|uniref:Carboxypeptidase B-like protein n=1 Tax=Leptotrombidium deliense TaxID=299467 RepID=A0A443SID3_9ACAR|nr:carboxypeptidase B-like protein [Leptotrombidium deliense]
MITNVQTKGLTVWNDMPVVNGTLMAHVASEHKESALKSLDDLNVKYEIVSHNLQEIIDKEKQEAKKKRVAGGYLNFETYNTLRDIYDYLNSLPQKYAGMATPISIGRTHENRDIRGVIIRNTDSVLKEIVFFECGIHAREWVSTATCLWIINELLSKQNSLLQRFEFHIIPVVNPDGYSYTWTIDRLWRKNRSPSGNGCFGVDLNRNFDIDFCRVGCSRNPCDKEVYCGAYGFSERETQAVRDYVFSIEDRLKVYFDLHAFAQVWMYPYSYKKDYADNYYELDELSRIGVTALSSVSSTQYRRGPISQVISSLDWVYENTNCKLCFALELRDTGRYGFILPPSLIRPTAIETWTGISATLSRIPR